MDIREYLLYAYITHPPFIASLFYTYYYTTKLTLYIIIIYTYSKSYDISSLPRVKMSKSICTAHLAIKHVDAILCLVYTYLHTQYIYLLRVVQTQLFNSNTCTYSCSCSCRRTVCSNHAGMGMIAAMCHSITI